MTSGILPSRVAFVAVLSLGGIATLGLILAWLASSPRLPYQDSFEAGRMDEWAPLGGSWKVGAGAVRNNSAEPGAKLMTGASNWTDYAAETNVQLLGEVGDAGLIVRSGDEQQGLDSYSGYYVGLRITDGSLVIGRADHGWREYQDSPMIGGVHPYHWYHLRVVTYGCSIAATATNPTTGATTTVALKDDPDSCAHEGRIGLRSNLTGGIWKDIRVVPATEQDLTQLAGTHDIPQSELALLPLKRVLDINKNRFRSQALQSSEFPLAGPTEPLQNLRLVPPQQNSKLSVQGVVILTQPDLYIQDSTGGASISGDNDSRLRIGDEVEVTGVDEPGDFSATLRNASVHLLWAGTPDPPLAITVSRAATGDFDARFVELEGYLDSIVATNKSLILDLHDGDQRFRAILTDFSANSAVPKLALGSLLRVRGVCVTSSKFTGLETPFVLLLRSTDDVRRLAGPPWWNARNLATIAVCATCVFLLGYLFYIRAEQWRLHAIIEERQRLAHELHDTLAQSFAGVGFQLKAILKTMPVGLDSLRGKLEVASLLVDQGHHEARRSISTLRPNVPETLELLPALAEAARAMVSGGSVVIQTSTTGDSRQLPLRITDVLYRVGIEAVANAVRHAHATRIGLTAEYRSHALILTIEDDGEGFVPEEAREGFGLRGMKKRVEQIGGVIQMSSMPKAGSRIEVSVPIPGLYRFRFSLFHRRPNNP